MFQQIAALIFPMHRLEYVSLEMPQDVVNLEESKDQIKNEYKLVQLIRQLQR
jgi:hypothetical protein